jgi:hypothetical protein
MVGGVCPDPSGRANPCFICLGMVRPRLAAEVPVETRRLGWTGEPIDPGRGGQTASRAAVVMVDTAAIAAIAAALRSLGDELTTAIRCRSARAVRCVANRASEPATVFGARRCLAVATRVVGSRDDLQVPHFGGVHVSEVAEVRSALERAALVSVR